jgi:two-component system nitrogen regulation response regulator NtrX
MARLLLVDDEPNILKSVGDALGHEGYDVVRAATIAQAKAAAADSFDAVLLDVWLPDGSGLEWLPEFKAAWPDAVVIMISGHAELTDAVQATHRGAFDFLEKPLSLVKLLITLQNGLEIEALRRERLRQRQTEASTYAILGKSKEILEVLATIEQVAKSDARVLIEGENGTGKELVARQIHMQSDRAAGPFVAVNCAALPENLVESELFGHEKGAFTGAVKAQAGRFEQAQGGTLFLDEVGDLPAAAQAKLLRVLEEKTVRRLGSGHERNVDARILAASNRSLSVMVQDGAFRQDLLFRLSVVPIVVPPLRTRPGDIELLANTFLEQMAGDGDSRRLLPGALTLLRRYAFPGNIRELRNMMERLHILTSARQVSEQHLLGLFPEMGTAGGAQIRPYAAQIDDTERAILLKALDASGWNVTTAAKHLNLERSHLHKKMKALELERPEGS